MADDSAAAPPVDDVPLEPPAKKKKGDKGLPKGIAEHRSGKYQARLTYKDDNDKTTQRFIPGLFATVEEAVKARAEADEKLKAGGPVAVWLTAAPGERNKRGQVSTQE